MFEMEPEIFKATWSKPFEVVVNAPNRDVESPQTQDELLTIL